MDVNRLRGQQPSFVETIVSVHGWAGEDWLSRLPALVADVERRWGIAVGAPFPALTYNFVALAELGDDGQAVLKLGVPNPELLTEMAALRQFDGRGCARLLAADEEIGALLLECVEPGTPLSDVADDTAGTSAAASVMRRLWRPAPVDHPFPTVERWGKGFERLRARFGGSGPFPPALVAEAESLFRDLLASPGPAVVLHGDLHHANILAAEREPWLAIDPKGVVGEAAYEVGALLRNPFPEIVHRPDAARVLVRRVDQLAGELGFERDRIRGWGLAQAVLSAWWCVEDNVPCWEPMIRCAELLAGIRA